MRPSRLSVGTFLNSLIVLIFGISIVVIVFHIRNNDRKRVLDEAKEKALILMDHNLAVHTFYAHDLKPSLFSVMQDRDFDRYFDPNWMSSTFAVRQIHRYFHHFNSSNFYYKECAINARSPENEADEYEKAYLLALNAGRARESRDSIRYISGRPFYEVMKKGEVIEQSCLRCHSAADAAPIGLTDRYGETGSFAREIGEVASVISIRVPLAQAYAESDRHTRSMALILVLVLLCIFLCLYIVQKLLITRPLKILQQQAREIVKDDASLGKEVRLFPGAEFYGLITSFNAMSKKLRANIDGLEETVDARTGALKRALDEVRTLKGILPFCTFCKKIRKDDGFWERVDHCIAEHSDAEVSHGICPECFAREYPEEFEEYRKKCDPKRPPPS